MKRSFLYALTLTSLILVLLSGCSRTNRKTQPDTTPQSGQPTAASAVLPQLKTLPSQPAQVSPSEVPAAAQGSQPQAAATVESQQSQTSADLNNLADDIDKSLNSLQKDMDATDPLNSVP
jgi:hypothetical protein